MGKLFSVLPVGRWRLTTAWKKPQASEVLASMVFESPSSYSGIRLQSGVLDVEDLTAADAQLVLSSGVLRHRAPTGGDLYISLVSGVWNA